MQNLHLICAMLYEAFSVVYIEVHFMLFIHDNCSKQMLGSQQETCQFTLLRSFPTMHHGTCMHVCNVFLLQSKEYCNTSPCPCASPLNLREQRAKNYFPSCAALVLSLATNKLTVLHSLLQETKRTCVKRVITARTSKKNANYFRYVSRSPPTIHYRRRRHIRPWFSKLQ